MQTTPNHLRFTILAGMILAAAAFRIIPHPPNFSPIAAIALFGGAQFSDKRAAFLVPLAAMFLGDLVLDFHALIPVIYGCFVLIVCLGLWLRRHRGAGSVALAALASSVFFFAVSNFAVWIGTDMYPKTIAGLGACFIAALPYFQNTLAGDAVFNAMLFGGLLFAEQQNPQLKEVCPA